MPWHERFLGDSWVTPGGSSAYILHAATLFREHQGRRGGFGSGQVLVLSEAQGEGDVVPLPRLEVRRQRTVTPVLSGIKASTFDEAHWQQCRGRPSDTYRAFEKKVTRSTWQSKPGSLRGLLNLAGTSLSLPRLDTSSQSWSASGTQHAAQLHHSFVIPDTPGARQL